MTAASSAKDVFATTFEQPKASLLRGVQKTGKSAVQNVFWTSTTSLLTDICTIEVSLPQASNGQLPAIHSRIGQASFEGEVAGAFSPKMKDGSTHLSRHWSLVAFPSGSFVQILLVPDDANNMLSGAFALPDNVSVLEIGFYGDDGKSTLFSQDSDASGKEGRQALGLLVRTGDDEAFWVIPYDDLLFEYRTSFHPLDLQSATPVQPVGKDDDDESMGEDVGFLVAKSKWYLESTLLHRIQHSLTNCTLNSSLYFCVCGRRSKFKTIIAKRLSWNWRGHHNMRPRSFVCFHF